MIIVFTTRDYLVANKTRQFKNDLLATGSIYAEQVAPFMSSSSSEYTKNFLSSINNEFSEKEKVRAILVDLEHIGIVDSGQQYEHSVVPVPLLDESAKGFSETKIYRHGDRHVLYVTIPIVYRGERYGSVFLSREAKGLFTDVNRLVENIIVTGFIVSIIAIFVAFIFAEMLIGPVERLRESVEQIGEGKYNIKVDESSEDEIGALGKAFNTMSNRLSNIEERRKSFVSNVSHELRTPIASIKIITDTLVEKPHWNEEVYREFIMDIREETTRLGNMIDSFLSLARLERDEVDIDLKLNNVNELIRWVKNRIQPLAQQKNIDVYVVPKPFVNGYFDKEKVQQCLLNIVANSVKYTPEGGKVALDVKDGREGYTIVITDSGIGIPKEDIPHIFDRFYRVDEARTRATGGTGLGLAIAQQIVLLHKGKIHVESEKNEGTSVYVFLPKNKVSSEKSRK